jgi:outer membrane protein TolC
LDSSRGEENLNWQLRFEGYLYEVLESDRNTADIHWRSCHGRGSKFAQPRYDSEFNPRPIGELASTRSPYLGSVSTESLRPGAVDLSIGEAIDRGLRVNLGLLLSSTNSEKSRAEHWRAISRLLPHLDGSLRESTRRINPRALGIPVPNLPATVDVSNSGAQVSLTQSLFDLADLSRSRLAQSSEKAAQSDYGHARETVVVAVSSAYLLAVTRRPVFTMRKRI